MVLKIRLFGEIDESVVDGPGIRSVIFMQGCPHQCPGCHNPKSHQIDGGYEKEVVEIIASLNQNQWIDGITISGGEPFLQPRALLEIVRNIKHHIVIYSGYTYEQIIQMGHQEILDHCEILVDGKFELNKKSLTLLYRGSSNQRMIDLKKTKDQIVLVNFDDYGQII